MAGSLSVVASGTGQVAGLHEIDGRDGVGGSLS
jgi:hypothetical protein